MDINKKAIRVLRQLDAESEMLDDLQAICDRFSSILGKSRIDVNQPLDLKPSEDMLANFVINARTVVAARQKTLDVVNIGNVSDTETTIRQFIQRSPEPMRTQLEQKRVSLINRLHDIKSQVAGDSAVVFYAFDFYRRIINGLVNCISEEQSYDQDGKSTQKNPGKIVQKAC